MVKPLTQVTYTTALMLVAVAFYSSTTLAQVPRAPSEAKPQSGCLSGYPDGRYQGDRPVTRNEFAAGVNACLQQVDQLLPNRNNMATRADFAALIKRQQELNQQLRELNNRVGNSSTVKK